MRTEVAVLLLLFAPLALATSSGELTALSDLYYDCNGDGWLNNSNWLVGDPCENSTFTWYGVSCESDHVVGLYLNDNGLSGALPSSLENLYDADTFSLFNNEISGSIPENWNTVRTLVKIDLHGNLLSGTIPDSLGDLLDYNLNYLDLSDNELTGAIPDFFDGAEETFVYVDLSGNRFVCPIPSWASYTEASCIELTLTTTQPLCVENGIPYLVFGTNFLGLDDLECTLLDLGTGELLSSSPALVIGDDVLQCIANYPFVACNGTFRGGLYAHARLTLTYEGQEVTSNSSTVTFGVTNPLCPYGISPYYITDSNGVKWSIPHSSDNVLEVCTSTHSTGNPTPWECPSTYPRPSTNTVYIAHIHTNCESAGNVTCLWTPAYYSTTYPMICPFFQCYSTSGCSYIGSCESSSYYGATCYTNQPDCDHAC